MTGISLATDNQRIIGRNSPPLEPTTPLQYFSKFLPYLSLSKMDSDADSSNLLPPTVDSTDAESKKGRTPTAQLIWAHTRSAEGEEPQFYKNQKDRPIKYCIYCKESSYSTSVTTNMRSHLNLKHQILINSILSKLQQAITNQLQQLYLKAKSLVQQQKSNIKSNNKT